MEKEQQSTTTGKDSPDIPATSQAQSGLFGRFSAWLFCGLSTGFIFILLFLCLLLYSQSSREWFYNSALPAGLNTLGISIKLEGLNSPEFDVLTIEHLSVQLPDDSFIEIKQFDFKFDLNRLFYQKIDIHHLNAASINLNFKSSSTKSEPFDIHSFLSDLSDLTWQLSINSLLINELKYQVDESKFPSVNLQGRLDAFRESDLLNGNLSITTIHASPLHAELSAKINRDFVGYIKGSVNEGQGGWLSERLQLPESLPLNVQMNLSSQLEDQDLTIDINQLTLPFLKHLIKIGGQAQINTETSKVSVPSLMIDINGKKQILSGSYEDNAIELFATLDQLPIAISEPFQDYLKGGSVTGTTNIKGSLDKPILTADLKLESLFKQTPIKLAIKGEGSQHIFSIQSGSLNLGKAKLKTHGDIMLIDESLLLNIEQLSGPLNIIELFDVSLPTDLNIQLEETQGILEGKFTNLNYSGNTKAQARYVHLPVQIQGKFNGNFEHVKLENTNLKSNDSAIQLQGLINWHDETLNLNVDAKRLRNSILSDMNIEIPIDLNFNADSKLAISGSFHDPIFRGKISADTLIEKNKLQIKSDYSSSLSQITLNNLEAHGEKGSIRANGFIDWKKMKLDITLSAQNLNYTLLEQFRIKLPEGLQGQVNIDGRIYDELVNPSFVGDASTLLSFKKQQYALSGQINRSPKRIEIRELVSDLPKSQLSGNTQVDTSTNTVSPYPELSGWLIFEPETQKIQSDLKIKNLSYHFVELLEISLPPSLDGYIDADINIMNALPIPDIKANISSKGTYKDERFNIKLSGHKKESTMHLANGLLEWNKTSLSANGFITDDNLDLHIRLDELNPAELNPLGYQFNHGSLNVTLDLSGTPQKPTLKGLSELVIQQGADDQTSSSIKQSASPIIIISEIDSADKQLFVKTTVNERSDSKGTLEIQAEYQSLIEWLLDKQDSRPFNTLPMFVKTVGNVRLNWLNNFIDKDIQNVSGEISLDTFFNGSIAIPKVKGELRLNNGRYSNAISQTLIEKANMLVRFNEEEIILEKATAEDGNNGKIDLSGKAVFPNNNAGLVDLHLNLNQASLIRREDIEGDATGAVHLTGNFEELAVKGDIHITPFQIMLDLIPKDSIPEIKITQAQETNIPSENQIKLPPTNLNMKLIVDQQAFIRGRGLDAELKGFIGLTGTVHKPFYNGQFDVIRGSFELFAKKFKLENGSVLFANDAVSLFVLGRHTSKEITFIATLSGSIDNLKINLRTEPTLPEDEAVSRLLFGKSIKNITPIQAIQLASAIQTLRGESSKIDPLGTARNLLHVDSISVESQETSKGDNGISMGVGKYLTDRVYVEIARTPEPSQPWKGSIEIELSPSVNLETTTGNNTGFGGVELQWKNDY